MSAPQRNDNLSWQSRHRLRIRRVHENLIDVFLSGHAHLRRRPRNEYDVVLIAAESLRTFGTQYATTVQGVLPMRFSRRPDRDPGRAAWRLFAKHCDRRRRLHISIGEKRAGLEASNCECRQNPRPRPGCVNQLPMPPTNCPGARTTGDMPFMPLSVC